MLGSKAARQHTAGYHSTVDYSVRASHAFAVYLCAARGSVGAKKDTMVALLARQLGVRGLFLRVLVGMYMYWSVRARCKQGIALSAPFECTSGGRQKDPLPPALEVCGLYAGSAGAALSGRAWWPCPSRGWTGACCACCRMPMTLLRFGTSLSQPQPAGGGAGGGAGSSTVPSAPT